MSDLDNDLDNNFFKELQLLSLCANIPLDSEVLENMTMNKIKQTLKKQILENHKYKIYYSESENVWRTYLPDTNNKYNRRIVKRRDKENLENIIIEFYLEQMDKNEYSLQRLYEDWLIYRRDETSAKSATIRKDMGIWNTYYKDTELAQVPVKDIKPIMLIRFFRKLTKDRQYTRKHISNVKGVLSGMFSYAVENEVIEHNPIVDVNFKQFTYKPVKRQSDNVYTKEQARQLLTYLKNVNEPYSLAIQLMFCLFVRIGEVKALQWDMIDFDKRTIRIERQLLQEPTLNDDLTLTSKEVVVDENIKGGTSYGFRTEYMTDEAYEILQKSKEINPTGKFVFMPYDRPMLTDRFNKYLKRYCQKVGIPYHSSHKIRFYTCSTAYDGTNINAISKMMGHSQLSTTMHYLRDTQQSNDMSDVFKNLGCQ